MHLFAAQGYAEVLSILAFFGSFWLAVTIIASAAILTSYWRKSRERELSAQLVQQMLQQKMTSEEILRILTQFHGKPEQAPATVEKLREKSGGLPPFSKVAE